MADQDVYDILCTEFREARTGSPEVQPRETPDEHDVIIIVEGKEFQAHKAILASHSDYFSSVFKDHFSEGLAANCEVRLTCTTCQGMRGILDYMYTGKVLIDRSNVTELFTGAHYLLMPKLKGYCVSFLEKNTDVSSCLQVKSLASFYSIELHGLLEQSREFIRNHFTELADSDAVLQVSAEDLLEIVADDMLRVKDEQSVYSLVVRWTHYDVEKRRQHFPMLLQNVRLPQLGEDFLANVVLKTKLVTEDVTCKELVIEAITVIQNPPEFEEDGLGVMSRARRGTLRNVITVINGHSQDIFCLDTDENCWGRLKTSTDKCLWSQAVAVLDGHLYLAGGSSDSVQATNDVHRFDPLTNQWYYVCPMKVRRQDFCLVPLDGKLYAICGSLGTGSRYKSHVSVESYSPAQNTWTFVASTWKPCFNSQAIAISNTHRIYCLGTELSTSTARQNTVFLKYNSEVDQWETRSSPQADVLGSILQMAGDDVILQDLVVGRTQVYHDVEDLWVLVPSHISAIPDHRYSFTSCAVDSKIFVFGGEQHWAGMWSGSIPRDTYQEAFVYDKESDARLWQALPEVPARVMGQSTCCKMQVPLEYLEIVFS
ncbi:kelch-like protein diablo [Branchiostoma lanceolatum]|uniref:kelch-like protein diablo n=1 Tax=Branchiostoma lanceolatum TaxID=7740 RepID=UPI0034547CC4